MTYTVTELLSELDDVLAALDDMPPAETLRLVWPGRRGGGLFLGLGGGFGFLLAFVVALLIALVVGRLGIAFRLGLAFVIAFLVLRLGLGLRVLLGLSHAALIGLVLEGLKARPR